jgi:hypothetical protein
MTNNIITCADVKQNHFTKESIVWIGDNLGSQGEIFIEVRTSYGQVFLGLEQALRSIDQFFEYGRRRVLSALPLHFDMGSA